jgi:hypothetical protein
MRELVGVIRRNYVGVKLDAPEARGAFRTWKYIDRDGAPSLTAPGVIISGVHVKCSPPFLHRGGSMFRGIDFENGIDKFRERARKMSDDELIRQGKECRSLCSPESNYGKPPLDIWV